MMIEHIKRHLPQNIYMMLRSNAIWAKRNIRTLFGVRNGVCSLRGVKIDISHPLITKTIKNAILAGTYESHESALIRRFVASDDIILELGSGIGYITILTSKIVSPDHIYGFEANPNLEPLLRRNFSLNNLSPQLAIAMLGRGTGEETFYVSSEFWASSLIEDKEGRAVTVPRRDLNDTIGEIKPTVLICDIEGGETDIVAYLKPQTLRTVIFECHPKQVGMPAIDTMISRLADLGFRQEHRSYEFAGASVFQYVGCRRIPSDG